MNDNSNKPNLHLPTRKQLERSISHDFAKFYAWRLGWSPRNVACTIFANYLIIVAEEALTPVETAIKALGEVDILLQTRQSIDKAIEPQLSELIWKQIAVEIEDLFCNINFDTGRMIAFANLAEEPRFRAKKSKYNKNNS